MGHEVKIVNTAIYYLSNQTYAIMQNFSPKTPNDGDTSIIDTIETTFYSATTNGLRGMKRDIELQFEAARRRAKSKNGIKTYLIFKYNGDTTEYRTEIINGKVEIIENSLHESTTGFMKVRVYVEHVPFWEGTRTQLTLTNPNGTNNTSGLTIKNCTDSGRANYVSIDYNEVTGSLWTPIELEIKNLTAARQIKNVYAYVDNDNTGSINFVPQLEGEAGTASGSSNVVLTSAYSGNTVKTIPVNTTNSITWTLTSAQLQYASGRNFTLLGKFSPNITGIYASASLSALGTTIAQTKEVLLGEADKIQNIGTFALPPGGEAWSLMPLTLTINFRAPSNATVLVDFVHFMLSDDKCFFHGVMPADIWVDINDKIIIDLIEEDIYLDSVVTNIGRIPLIYGRGNGFYFSPTQEYKKIYFLIDGVATSADWNFAIKAFYRPRVPTPF